MDDKATMNGIEHVPFEDRVLLLPHCLRPSATCSGRMTKQGLDCGGCEVEDCAVGKLMRVAVRLGYGGVCVAPGGRMAVRFVLERQPAGVVAVACDKELEEGLEALSQIAWRNGNPVIATVPLLVDGCVDTVVDVQEARRVIEAHVGACTEE